MLLHHGDLLPQPALLQHHQGRKDFGGAGNPHPFVSILLVEDLPRIAIHEHRRRGRQVHDPHLLRQQQQYRQRGGNHLRKFQSPSPFLQLMVTVYAVRIR